ncbi:hypothetical protein [Labedaea rhizosphaerae]|uniref:Uncharacterized protein n=1 Tax=Labedaea rhizosphaerae TaxID=598644 RepID=A0A4R6RXU0_LABRH|nr:hypothetical protein [Labedaea rhizosphaerae]TDP91175.1 hypothetical protein EV186_109167 [Labedaea rhizosphaerae]
MTNPYGQPGQDPQQAGGYQQSGGYPQSGGFQQPGTPPGGYQQPGTPPGGYAQPAYPSAPSYPSSGQNPNQLLNTRPGSATAAAVLGFVQAGITLITTILMLIGLAGVGSGGEGGELALAWIVTLAQALGAALLIYGGVQLVSGTGRTIFLAGVGVELAICLYYLIRILSLDTSGELPGASELKSSAAMIPILFAVMPVIALCLALTGNVATWAQSKRAR